MTVSLQSRFGDIVGRLRHFLAARKYFSASERISNTLRVAFGLLGCAIVAGGSLATWFVIHTSTKQAQGRAEGRVEPLAQGFRSLSGSTRLSNKEWLRETVDPWFLTTVLTESTVKTMSGSDPKRAWEFSRVYGCQVSFFLEREVGQVCAAYAPGFQSGLTLIIGIPNLQVRPFVDRTRKETIRIWERRDTTHSRSEALVVRVTLQNSKHQSKALLYPAEISASGTGLLTMPAYLGDPKRPGIIVGNPYRWRQISYLAQDECPVVDGAPSGCEGEGGQSTLLISIPFTFLKELEISENEVPPVGLKVEAFGKMAEASAGREVVFSTAKGKKKVAHNYDEIKSALQSTEQMVVIEDTPTWPRDSEPKCTLIAPHGASKETIGFPIPTNSPAPAATSRMTNSNYECLSSPIGRHRILVRSYAEAESEAVTTSIAIILAFSAILLGLVIASWRLVEDRVIRRIGGLAAQSREAMKMDFKVDSLKSIFGQFRSKDEIGTLAAALDNLLVKNSALIQQREAEIQAKAALDLAASQERAAAVLALERSRADALALEKIATQEASRKEMLEVNRRIVVINSIRHEIKSPLGVARSAIDIGDYRAARAAIVQSAGAAEAILSIDAPEGIVSQNVNSKVQDIAEFLLVLTQNASKYRGIQDVQYDGPSSIYVNFDESILTQVFEKLLDNGIRYRDTGTPIIMHLRGGDYVTQIKVINKGPRIIPDRLKSIFEYGVSDKAADHRGQRGYGLFVALILLAKMEASIEAANTNDGVEFVICFPGQMAV